MKVRFKSNNGSTLNSGGVKFVGGREYEVTEKVGKYLLDTFGDTFEEIVVKPKAAPKPKASPKKDVKED